LKLSERDYFVLKFADGSFYTDNMCRRQGKLENASLIWYLEDAEYIKNLYEKVAKLEVMPVMVTIKEIEKRELLCYFMNPIFGNGWDFRADESMKYYWRTIVPYDGYGALTD